MLFPKLPHSPLKLMHHCACSLLPYVKSGRSQHFPTWRKPCAPWSMLRNQVTVHEMKPPPTCALSYQRPNTSSATSTPCISYYLRNSQITSHTRAQKNETHPISCSFVAPRGFMTYTI